jgi:hypothetical protein
MDPQRENDRTLQQEATPARRFEAHVEELGATYPMLAPAAVVIVGHEADIFDEEILAGLVNA